jgi:hypothetical protein
MVYNYHPFISISGRIGGGVLLLYLQHLLIERFSMAAVAPQDLDEGPGIAGRQPGCSTSLKGSRGFHRWTMKNHGI